LHRKRKLILVEIIVTKQIRKETSMSNFNTELYKALASGSSIDEIVRSEIESCVNFLLKTELTSFLDYEPYDTAGYNTGNSRNGYYTMLVRSRPAMAISRFRYLEIVTVNSSSRPSGLINEIQIIWKRRSYSFIPKESPFRKSVI
jgi:hypothetical protein